MELKGLAIVQLNQNIFVNSTATNRVNQGEADFIVESFLGCLEVQQVRESDGSSEGLGAAGRCAVDCFVVIVELGSTFTLTITDVSTESGSEHLKETTEG